MGLANCCKQWLNRPLDKAEQTSDWSGALTQDQLAYAALDAEVPRPLLAAQLKDIATAKLERVAEIERRCQPAVLWITRQGVAFDRARWQQLAQEAGRESERVCQELDQQAPNRPGTLEGTAPGIGTARTGSRKCWLSSAAKWNPLTTMPWPPWTIRLRRCSDSIAA